MFPEELTLLQTLAKKSVMSPVVVLNIGSGAGTSGLAFAECRRDLVLHTVDITDEPHPRGCLDSERVWIRGAELGDKWNKSWFQHHMSSLDLAKIWEEKTNSQIIDILFVDGDHTYEGCKGDILGFYPYVREGGFILVHDYDKGSVLDYEHGPIPKVLPEVTKAVDDILPDIATIYDRVQTTIVYRK